MIRVQIIDRGITDVGVERTDDSCSLTVESDCGFDAVILQTMLQAAVMAAQVQRSMASEEGE